MAAVPGLAARCRAERAGAGRGDRNGRGGARARAAARLLGRRHRPEPGDARRRTAARCRARARREDRAARGASRGAAVPRRLVRCFDRHVPAPVRRRSGGDDRRARPRRASGRNDGAAGLRRPAIARGSRSLGALRADRAAVWPDACSLPAGTRWDASSARASATSKLACPLERQLELWSEAGMADVRARRLSLGGGVVVWGQRG